MIIQLVLALLLTATKAQMSFGDTLACHTIGHRCHTIGQDLLKKLLKQIDSLLTYFSFFFDQF